MKNQQLPKIHPPILEFARTGPAVAGCDTIDIGH